MAQGFSGKLNILAAGSGQFFGSVFLTQGLVTGGYYRNLTGRDAVILICYHGMPGQKPVWGEAKFVPEPETISPAQQQVKWDFNDLQVELHRYFLAWAKLQELMPRDDLHLLAMLPPPSSQPSCDQFQILSLLSQESRVSEVFLHSPFLPAQTLEILISMRKIGWIRVAASV